MRKVAGSDYLFLAISSLSLFGGLVVAQLRIGLEVTIWAIGAAVGLFLAINWVIKAFRQGEFGSDSLAVIAISATALTNEWIAASVISLMLATGRALETWAEGQARKRLESLLERAPRNANVVDANSEVRQIDVDQVKVGDRVLVRTGEIVPIDGVLASRGTFDTSALTGESLPRTLESGEDVESGVVNASAPVELVASRLAKDSTYSNLIRLVEASSANSALGVRLANKWAIYFVPLAIVFALATWLFTGEIDRAVAVIVAATPCPLILAVPVALISGMSRASARGAVIKGGAAIEKLAKAKVVMVDKTGTLTFGGPSVTSISVAPGHEDDYVLSLAASLEQQSPHPVARAIVDAARERHLNLSPATDVSEDPGHGITGTVAGNSLRVGQPSFPLPSWASDKHALLVSVELDGELVAVFGLDDPIRPDAHSTIKSLRKLGVERVLLVSGDRAETVKEVGEAVGVDVEFAECRPEDKLRLVDQEITRAPDGVIFAGDGINDAPALTRASAGVAMGARGTTAASEAADVVIVEDSIKHLAIAIDVAKGARRRALQAAGGGMGLAFVAMILASSGILNATASAVTQEFIDVAAILWALVPPRKRI